MEAIDVLTQVDGDAASFVVNNAVVDVAVVIPGLADMRDASGKFWFQRGESFRLLSVGFRLPHYFVLSQVTAIAHDETIVTIGWENRTASKAGLLPVLANGQTWVPFGDYELALDVFVNMADVDTDGQDWKLQARFQPTLPRISMIGVDAALNGLTYYAPIFVKVLHNEGLKV